MADSNAFPKDPAGRGVGDAAEMVVRCNVGRNGIPVVTIDINSGAVTMDLTIDQAMSLAGQLTESCREVFAASLIRRFAQRYEIPGADALKLFLELRESTNGG